MESCGLFVWYSFCLILYLFKHTIAETMLSQREHLTFHLWPVHVSLWSASLFASFWELFKSSGISFVSLWHYGSLFCWSLLSCFTWFPCIDHPQNGDDDQCYGREKAHNARRAVIFGNVGPHLQGSTWINVDQRGSTWINGATCKAALRILRHFTEESWKQI